MNVEPAFVADGETAEPADPGEGTLNYPPVAAEFLAGFDAATGNSWLDLTLATSTAAAPMVVGFVGVQLVWPSSWTAALACDCRNSVQQLFEGCAVVDIGPGQEERKRDAPPIGDEMTLGAGSATIRRVRTCGTSPLFAAMDALSMQARLQSIRSASRSRRSNSRCRRSHTPAACQSRNRRQQVTPEPHPISMGSISQGMPVRSTNRMPVSAARAEIGGRPPFGRKGADGNKGSMICQSSSETRGEGIPPHESAPIRVQGF